MDNLIEQLFNEIPEFDQENAAIILKENCEKIADQLLTVSTTTLDSDEESMYGIANIDLLHTRYKEVDMAFQAYTEWEEDKTDGNRKSYKDIFNLAIHHIKINLANFF
ncbi:MAG: hypothetical protein M3Q95_04875 [Bacteroidota bacterium]|nr:hypothetical protein [Bacteroidota bacterium]